MIRPSSYLAPPTDRDDDWGEDRCVALIRKAGSSSMSAVLSSWVEVPVTTVMDISLRVAFIREPITKLISAYSFFRELHKRGTKMQSPPAPTKDAVESWESFVDYALDNYNVHWTSQVDYLTQDGVYVPTHTHRFEDIGTIWQQYFNTRLLPNYNACVHQEVDNYRADDLQEFYKKDLELWHSV